MRENKQQQQHTKWKFNSIGTRTKCTSANNNIIYSILSTCTMCILQYLEKILCWCKRAKKKFFFFSQLIEGVSKSSESWTDWNHSQIHVMHESILVLCISSFHAIDLSPSVNLIGPWPSNDSNSNAPAFLASHIHHVSTTSNQFQESVNFDDASFSCNFSSFYTIIILCTCTSSLFLPRTVFVSVARFPNPNFVTNRTHFVEWSELKLVLPACIFYIHTEREREKRTMYTVVYTMYAFCLCAFLVLRLVVNFRNRRLNAERAFASVCVCSMMEANKLYKFHKMVP